MTSKKAAAGRKPSASMKAVPPAAAGGGQIVSRPDGHYWLRPDGRQEFGPFASVEDALADMLAADEEAPEPGESLQEAESELGVADWIDPETGEPPEGLSPPHLDED